MSSALNATYQVTIGAWLRTTDFLRSPVARIGAAQVLILAYIVGANVRTGGTRADVDTPGEATQMLYDGMAGTNSPFIGETALPMVGEQALQTLFIKPLLWVASIGIDIGYAAAGWLPLAVAEGLAYAAVVATVVYGVVHVAGVLTR